MIGESLLTPDEFLKGCLVTRFQTPSIADLGTMDPLAYESAQDYFRAQANLWMGSDLSQEPVILADALKQHAFFRNLLMILGNRAVAAGDLAAELKKQLPGFGGLDDAYLDRLLGSFLALVSHAKVLGPVIDVKQKYDPLVQIRMQLWLRELRRMVASVRSEPSLGFADDLKPDELKRSCRSFTAGNAGTPGGAARSGMPIRALIPICRPFITATLPTRLMSISFILTPKTTQGGKPRAQRAIPQYVCTECLNIQRMTEPGTCANCGSNFERMLPVWIPDTNYTVKKKDGTEKRLGSHDCPSCGGHNSLTILGSRAASLTSVIIAQLFSSPFNEDKKLLAFSDSVQDASHRSGFFAARTYTFNFRGAIQKTVRAAGGPVPFETLTARFIGDWRNG